MIISKESGVDNRQHMSESDHDGEYDSIVAARVRGMAEAIT